ncbi:MAG: AAA family ATPase [Vulcanimicrobiaceae bacterium]
MADGVRELGERVRTAIERIVVGNEAAIAGLLLALFGDGHLLIEGVPGTAKTLLARLLARLLEADFRRIQFTPDLLPSDVVGTTIFDAESARFALRRGPIFASVVLADEINRTPPKTQSALLEAMEERAVTIDGERHPLPAFFMVCATQNPIEFEGTYPLPEAQLDRFFARAQTGYPSAQAERALLARGAAGFDARDLAADGVVAVATTAELLGARAVVRTIFVAEPLVGYVQEIAAATRSARELSLGASPRAALALVRAAQTAAALEGRGFATPDDVKSSANAVLAHRLAVEPEAEIEGASAEGVLARILATVPVPQIVEPAPRA